MIQIQFESPFLYGGIVKYCLKWFGLFLGLTIITFVTIRLIPVSPVEMLLQQYNLPFTEENKSFLIREYGLDQSLIKQYLLWLKELLRGNFGFSFFTKLSVKEEMIKRLPYSFVIGFCSLLFSMVFAYFLGYISALQEEGLWDKISRGLAIFSLSFPSFIMAIIVIYYFGVKIKLFRFFTETHTWGILFSILILCLYQVGSLSRIVRKAFLQEKEKTYVQFYKIRGFEEKEILFYHCYKPVLYALLSASIARFSSLIGGSSVVEFAFSIPGVSFFLIHSIISRDYNVLQAYILIIFFFMFFVHLFFDFLLLFLKERRSQ